MSKRDAFRKPFSVVQIYDVDDVLSIGLLFALGTHWMGHLAFLDLAVIRLEHHWGILGERSIASDACAWERNRQSSMVDGIEQRVCGHCRYLVVRCDGMRILMKMSP